MDNEVIKNFNIKNNYLSEYACKDSEAIYLNDGKEDFRGTFYHDIDKILYSLSFTRYMDKTQVFSYKKHSHITKRMLHVLLVSKIARTIGRSLGLNEDLIEAISLGHDLGHVPFGHAGERILNDISMRVNEGYFNHNIQSVRNLLYVENYGKGLRVSIEVLDGIMCHNGEFEVIKLEPKRKTKEEFLDEYKSSYNDKERMNRFVAGTLEGCVVRISDMIAYLGRDIDDAIRMKLISRDDIPKNVAKNLGVTTSEIVNTIVNDVISNSINKPYIKLSENVYNAIKELKVFNYKNIYDKANSPEDLKLYNDMFNKLFEIYINDIVTNNKDSMIVSSFLKNMDSNYVKNNTKERIVIDYLAGMTDEYIKQEYSKLEGNKL